LPAYSRLAKLVCFMPRSSTAPSGSAIELDPDKSALP
jgi:hypothetical protein